VVLVDRVEMDVIELVVGVGWDVLMRLVDVDVVDEVPFEKDAPGVDLQFLNDAVEEEAIFRAVVGAEIPLDRRVDADESGIARGDHELVQVPTLVAVADLNGGNLFVRIVVDEEMADAVAGWFGALLPGEHWFAIEGLDPEVHRLAEVDLRRREPDGFAGAIHDHDAALAILDAGSDE